MKASPRAPGASLLDVGAVVLESKLEKEQGDGGGGGGSKVKASS